MALAVEDRVVERPQPIAGRIYGLAVSERVDVIRLSRREFFDRNDAKKALFELGPELAEDEVLKYANHKNLDVATVAREILAEFKTGSGKRLDQYLTDVREIERRIQKANQQLSADLKLPAAPVPR